MPNRIQKLARVITIVVHSSSSLYRSRTVFVPDCIRNRVRIRSYSYSYSYLPNGGGERSVPVNLLLCQDRTAYSKLGVSAFVPRRSYSYSIHASIVFVRIFVSVSTQAVKVWGVIVLLFKPRPPPSATTAVESLLPSVVFFKLLSAPVVPSCSAPASYLRSKKYILTLYR
jgi:hypothetical protein